MSAVENGDDVRPQLSKSNSTSLAVSHPLEPTGSPPLSPVPALRRVSSPSPASKAVAPAVHGNSSSPSNLNRNSVIGNFNNWISELNTTINNLPSPSAFLHNLNFSNPFSRKGKHSAKSSPVPSPLAVPRSKSESLNTTHPNSGSPPLPSAKFLNGTLIPTLKTKEVIELAHIGVVEVDTSERGVGHDFKVCNSLLI